MHSLNTRFHSKDSKVHNKILEADEDWLIISCLNNALKYSYLLQGKHSYLKKLYHPPVHCQTNAEYP